MGNERTQRSKMTPFSKLSESDGRPCDCHSSLSDALLKDSTMPTMTGGISVSFCRSWEHKHTKNTHYISQSSRKSISSRLSVFRHCWSNERLVLNVKNPEYVRNAAIRNPCPTRFIKMAWNPSLLLDQRSDSWLRLFIRLLARSTFVVTVSISRFKASTSRMRVAYSDL